MVRLARVMFTGLNNSDAFLVSFMLHLLNQVLNNRLLALFYPFSIPIFSEILFFQYLVLALSLACCLFHTRALAWFMGPIIQRMRLPAKFFLVSMFFNLRTALFLFSVSTPLGMIFLFFRLKDFMQFISEVFFSLLSKKNRKVVRTLRPEFDRQIGENKKNPISLDLSTFDSSE